MTLLFHWFRIDEIEGVRLHPTFLRTALGALPDSPVHVIHVDEPEQSSVKSTCRPACCDPEKCHPERTRDLVSPPHLVAMDEILTPSAQDDTVFLSGH